MRTTRNLVLAVLALLWAAGGAGASERLRIPRLDGVQVDGSLAEWQKQAPIGNWNEPDRIVWGGSNFSGQGDLGGRAWMAWDARYLYIAAEVIDDQHRQSQTGENMYRGDHLIVFLDADRQDPPADGPMGGGQFQIGLSPGSLTEGGDFLSRRPPEACVWHPQYVQGSGIAVAAKKLAAGYALEAAIPWSFLKLDPQGGLALGFDICPSDTDGSEPVQQTLASLKGGKWEITPSRWLAGELAGAAGRAGPASAGARSSKTIVISSDEVKLKAGEERAFTLTAPPADGMTPVVMLRARGVSDRLAGASPGLVVLANGKPLGRERGIGRPASVNFARGDAQSLYTGESWTLFYSPDYRALQTDKSSPYYIPATGPHADLYRYQFDASDLIQPGQNTLTVRFVVSGNPSAEMAFDQLAVRWMPPEQLAKLKQGAAPAAARKPVVVSPPRPLAPPQVSLAGGGAIEVRGAGRKWLIESQFSEPGGAWRSLGGGAPDPKWESFQRQSPAALSASTKRFALTRQIVQQNECAEVHEKLKNLTDQPQPVIIRHTLPWPQEKLARLTLNGREIALKRGIAQNAMNPTILLEHADGGALALVAVDDVLRLHHRAFYLEQTAGIDDPELVLAPGAEYEQVWQIYAPSGGYWDLVNAIRRQWEVNFPIDGPLAMLDPRRTSPQLNASVEQMRDILKNRAARIVTTMMVDTVTGAYLHGLQFKLQGDLLADLQKFYAKVRQADPDVLVANYFHCFITGASAAGEADPADALRDVSGQQVFYGGDKDWPIFIPTTTNRYGRQMEAQLKEMVAKLGLSAIYWDEQQYSFQQYHYGQPWDGVSGDIDPGSHELLRTKSHVTLISAPFRHGLMRWMAEKELSLTCNGPPMTQTEMGFHVRRFTETGSITNLFDTHLFTPIGLSDHLTERTHADTVRLQREFLDRGCLYDWYTPSLPVRNPGLVRWMYPITPIALGPGYIIGRERILTTHPGRFSWGEPKLPAGLEVHVIDPEGNEVQAKMKRIEEGGIEWLDLELPADHAAAIVRKD